ncbi:LysR substrate-binding domain-containing protein [Sporanaerobium hydrogeniformans]|uniref:LysR substrate-binding domain-containing protein n=1 Tax=Sporanaerobium hydrogeniformans TaxID=3072179 RepID=UPI0015D52205|nr:LysR substrate-binding domain-containing protein [Sporanaerobium hydrogeniformans]
MDLHYLKIFNTVAMHESFTRASEVLHISQPALSIQIKKLEEELELKLFDKAGNKIILNENGKLLYGYTQKVFAILGEAENVLVNKKDYIGGSITVGGSNTPGAYILPHIIGEFKKKYPYVDINLQIASTDEMARRVEEGIVDFAVNGGGVTYPATVEVEKLMEDELIIAISPLNLYARNRYISLEELQYIKFILHENNSQLNKVAKTFIEEFGLSAKKIEMTLGNIEAIKQAVIANLGLSLIPHAAIALELSIGVIKEVQIKGRSWYYPYNLIHNKNKYLSPAAKEFMKMVRKNMKTEENEKEHI